MKSFILLTSIILITSCSDTVVTDDKLLHNIVAMEDQLNRVNLVQHDRGTGFKMDVRSELSAISLNDNMIAKQNKLKSVITKMEYIDMETSFILNLIDKFKIELLSNAKENTTLDETRSNTSIVWRRMDPKVKCIPSRLNLYAVKNKDNNKISTDFFVGADNATPSVKGLKLWNALNDYRRNLVQIVGTYNWKNEEFNIKPDDINTYKNYNELEEKVLSMIKSNNCNINEDSWVLRDIYLTLTKPEKVIYSNASVHWINSTFKDSPLVNSLATLTTLEQEILSARALALAHWRSKVATNSYNFNTLKTITTGPSVSKIGERIQIEILLAAIDSDRKPEVTTTTDDSNIRYKDGVALLSFKPKAGLNKYQGTISFVNKAGVKKTEDWEWTINTLP